jgi:hypothetical protein
MAGRGPAHGDASEASVRDACKDDYLLLTTVAAGIEAARRGIERALDGLVDAGASTEG